MRILLTGATGFLGSHIAEHLTRKGHELILTKRNKSSLGNCQSFLSNVIWVNTDENLWEDKVIHFNPEIIIHAAWNGVAASERDHWQDQLTNIDFMYQLLKIAGKCRISKFISLGSQAEYGQIEGKVSEGHPLNPTGPYGAVKLAVSELLKVFCEENSIDWYWLRVFSVFGEKENEKWLIPSVVKNMLSGASEMDFTLGEQKYAYLYAEDFAEAITKVVIKKASSGIYNLSSDYLISLKKLIGMIKEDINPDFVLNFGRIPYRKNQSMHIEGDMSKFNSVFGSIDNSDFRNKLKKVVNSYKN